jgi:hypothetical protein
MRKPLILTLSFLVSMVVGVVLLLLLTVVVGLVQLAFVRHSQSGIGAVAGGISEASVLLVPLLIGVIGTLITLRRIERRKS